LLPANRRNSSVVLRRGWDSIRRYSFKMKEGCTTFNIALSLWKQGFCRIRKKLNTSIYR